MRSLDSLVAARFGTIYEYLNAEQIGREVAEFIRAQRDEEGECRWTEEVIRQAIIEQNDRQFTCGF